MLRLDGRGRACSLEHHLVCVVPLADEHRVDEPEAVIEGSLYHCHLSTIHESTVPAAAGVTDRWPGLKAEYFQDPQTKFQMAPDPSTKSQDEARKRRTSNVSSSAASSAGSAAGDRGGVDSGGGASSADGARPPGPSLQRLAELEKTVTKKQAELTKANSTITAANKTITAHADEITKVKTKLNTAAKTAKNRKDACDKLVASEGELKKKVKSLERERDDAIGAVQTAKDAKSAEKNLQITRLELQLDDSRVKLKHASKREKASKTKTKKKKTKRRKKHSDSGDDSSSAESSSDDDTASSSDDDDGSSSDDSSDESSDSDRGKKAKKKKKPMKGFVWKKGKDEKKTKKRKRNAGGKKEKKKRSK